MLEIVKTHHIVDVWSDLVRDQKGISIPVDQLDELETRIMNLARARFPG